MIPDWIYERADDLEISLRESAGRERLRPHFHPTHQVAVLNAGRRRFRVADRVFAIEAGVGLFIPAGLPHVGAGGQFEAFNVYLNAANYPALHNFPAFTFKVEKSVLEIGGSGVVARLLERASEIDSNAGGQLRPRKCKWLDMVCTEDFETSQCAAALGIARETFIRRFTREMHMAPATYHRQWKLNRARLMLGDGVAPTVAAIDAGFADQSHLGRFFRRSFGTTPAAYRASVT